MATGKTLKQNWEDFKQAPGIAPITGALDALGRGIESSMAPGQVAPPPATPAAKTAVPTPAAGKINPEGFSDGGASNPMARDMLLGLNSTPTDPNSYLKPLPNMATASTLLLDQPSLKTDLPSMPTMPESARPLGGNSSRGNSFNSPAGFQFSNPGERERFERGGVQELLRSPSPNVTRKLQRDSDTGKNYAMEIINGGPDGPALQSPITTPKGRWIIGHEGPKGMAVPTKWDDGVAAMAAANAGIAESNRSALTQWQQKTDVWKQGQPPQPAAPPNALDAKSKNLDITSKQLALSQQQQLVNLQNQAIGDDPALSAAALAKLSILNPKQAGADVEIFTEKDVDPGTGLPVQRSFAVNKNDLGNSVPIGSGKSNNPKAVNSIMEEYSRGGKDSVSSITKKYFSNDDIAGQKLILFQIPDATLRASILENLRQQQGN